MIDFQLEIIGTGWVQAVLNNETDEIKIEASYLSDALPHLVNTVTLLLEGRKEATCLWEGEPGEYRWILKNNEKELSIEILKLEKAFSRKENSCGEIIFDSTDKLISFARKVLNALNAFTLKMSPEDYKKIWGYEYPVQALHRLRQALKEFRSLNKT